MSESRVCPICGLAIPENVNTKYCSAECRKKRSRLWRQKYPEKQRKAKRNWQVDLHTQWGSLIRGYYNHTHPLVIQSELFVSNQVLPKHGFADIVLTREFSAFFPCDILCRKDGKVCLIEVTLGAERKINPRIVPLVKFLDATVFVCHVKHDFSLVFIKEVDVNKKLYSSCVGELRSVELRNMC